MQASLAWDRFDTVGPPPFEIDNKSMFLILPNDAAQRRSKKKKKEEEE